MPSSKTVSIKDVADKAGVSIMSVSRAMRGVEGLSRNKRQEILNVAKALGYEPNSMAGALAAANSTLIGVSVPTLSDDVFGEIFDGMRPVLTASNFQTVFDTTDYVVKREQEWIERMLQWRPAGLVLSGITHSAQTIRRLRNSGLPVLELWDYTDEPIDMCVGVDHFEAGVAMGEYLIGHGYRRPAYVGVKLRRDIRADKRRDGLAEAFQRRLGVETQDLRLDNKVSFEAGATGTERLLTMANELPDVIYYLNDHMAFGGLLHCQKIGLRVPEDIGIVGFNALNINDVLRQRITTSVTPRQVMGATGARMLVAKIRGAKTERAVAMPTDILPGDTTRFVDPN